MSRRTLASRVVGSGIVAALCRRPRAVLTLVLVFAFLAAGDTAAAEIDVGTTGSGDASKGP
ncbi:hypothetical protein [Halobaculum sp. EA56]|uniref:hypothetical protein n=1 Tax=Halobaculum sp. EA56 TaxID=3421648 RepID=UPI003EBCAF72